MSKKKTPQTVLNALLHGDLVRRVEHDGRTVYAAADAVALLTGTDHPAKYWADLKIREPGLGGLSQPAQFARGADETETLDAVDFDGLLRLVQSIPTARAERLKQWLAQTARERLEEEKNPELAVVRTRRLYEQRGYSRQWVDKRLRGVSARHELTGEWYKRGATDSDHFRALTNEIILGAFGMDVEGYRRYKNLFKTGENLRDHMTDLELALTSLGETVAVALHREHNSQGFEALESDAKSAGEIAARTRQEIEARTGRPVVQQGNHRGWWMGASRRSRAVDRSAQAGVTSQTSQPGQDAAEAVTPPEPLAASRAQVSQPGEAADQNAASGKAVA